jgi:hypothetical protein
MAQRPDGAPAGTRDAVLGFFVERIGLLIPIVSAVVFYIRCLAVSRGDVYTASILLSQSSIGDAIRALLLVTVPLVLLMATLLAVLAFMEEVVAGDVRSPRAVLFAFIALLGMFAAILLMGFGYVGAALVTALWIVVIGISLLAWYLLRAVFRLRDGLSAGPTLLSLRRALAGVAVLLLLFVLSGDAFWLPRERLSFRDQEPITGYVLNLSDGYVVVLRDDPRVVIERPLGDLVDRSLCSEFEVRDERIRDDFPLCP